MPYSIRILSPKVTTLSLEALLSDVPDAKITLEAGTSSDWEQLVLSHPNGTDIALIERNPVDDESLGAEEISEFLDEINDGKPDSAAIWLTQYLRRVRVVYAFQILSGTEQENGWGILGKFKSVLWNSVGGIFQADGEGFSNEDGYHILWQFSDNVSGPWWMGLLKTGAWVHFEMELGDEKQRQAFLKGEVPEGVRLA
jgi:hypothetical protein